VRKETRIQVKKPFDSVAQGLLTKHCRDDRTRLELFLGGIKSLTLQLSICDIESACVLGSRAAPICRAVGSRHHNDRTETIVQCRWTRRSVCPTRRTPSDNLASAIQTEPRLLAVHEADAPAARPALFPPAPSQNRMTTPLSQGAISGCESSIRR
jgi:hypothetical protein